jgi:regulatory protein
MLHDAALAYLARYAASEAGLRRVLHARIDRWERVAEDKETAGMKAREARQAAAAVIARLVAAGVVNDTAFAEARAHGLARAGRSRQAIAARLAAKGVSADIARASLPGDEEEELAAALILSRRRRIGAFRLAPQADAAVRMRELGVMARAGFPRAVALQALEMDAEIAEDTIRRFRQA